MKLILQIALGIVLAGVIWVAVTAGVVWYGAYVLDKEMKEQAEVTKREVEAQQAADREIQRQLEINKQHAAKLARSKAEYERKKELAWEAYYVAPRDCASYLSDKHMMECVNHKMQARRRFDHTYDPGTITIVKQPD